MPESQQTADYYEEESDTVERIQLSHTDAFDKFKGTKLSADKVDFSDRISKKLRTGYEVGNWELVAKGETETILQKYHRINCEIGEVMEEIQKIKTSGNGDDTDTLISSEQVEESLKKLADIRLEETLGAEVVSSITDPQGAQFK